MKNWQKISLILCTFGFFKELRPSEPFITEYIVEFKNVTAEEIIHVAFPVSTYTSLGTLAVVFLVTDFLRYKSVVVFEGFAYVLTWVVLIYGKDLYAIIIVEILYGIACSTEVAYYTYIYAQVDKNVYKRVTSHTSSSLYAGKFLGGLIAQILVTYRLMNYHELTYLTLLCSCFGLLATIFLPGVKSSIYFHHTETFADSGLQSEPLKPSVEHEPPKPTIEGKNLRASLKTGILGVNRHLKEAYGDKHILKWSIWWALASAGQFQVINYIQALWEKINEDGSKESYNGGVKALHTLLSSVFSLAVGYVKISWNTWGESLLCLISLIQGGMLMWMAATDNLVVAYFSYTIFRTIHPVMMTVASAEVAQKISSDSYGLVFGMNMFLALILQTILTVVISDRKGLALDERTQFHVYGFYFVSIGVLFFIVFLFSLKNTCKSAEAV